jgi:hypothetical protein
MPVEIPENRVQVAVVIDRKLRDDFRALCDRMGASFASELQRAMRRHLASDPRRVEDDLPDDARPAPARKPGRPATTPPPAAPAPATPGRSSAYEEALAKQKARKPAPKPQDAAERRTSARDDLAALEGESGVQRVSTREEGSCQNADA